MNNVALFGCLIMAAAYGALAQPDANKEDSTTQFAEKISKALAPFIGRQGIYGSQTQMGSFTSQSASRVNCAVDVKGGFFIIRPATASRPEDFYLKIGLDVFTSERDGSFLSREYQVPNKFSLCKGGTVSARYELKIDQRNGRVDFVQTGRCEWKYGYKDERAMVNYYDAQACGLF